MNLQTILQIVGVVSIIVSVISLTVTIRNFRRLCSEEYYLLRKGYTDHEIWKIWEDELKRTLGSQLFRREWPALKDEFKSDREFQKFVENVQDS